MTKDTTQRRPASNKPRQTPLRKFVPLWKRKHRDFREEELAYQVDPDSLEALAHYFGNCFEYHTEPMLVLVDLLRRLDNVAQGRQHGAMVNVEDTVSMLTKRLYIRCMEGEDAADKFQSAAERRAAKVLEPFLPDNEKA